jgi:hypothetical protein
MYGQMLCIGYTLLEPRHCYCHTENTRHEGSDEVISVRNSECAHGFDTPKLSHFPDTRLTDGGEVVALRAYRAIFSWKIFGTYLCYRLSQRQVHTVPRRITTIRKIQCPHRGSKPQTSDL